MSFKVITQERLDRRISGTEGGDVLGFNEGVFGRQSE
jgi:hypothetical protein